MGDRILKALAALALLAVLAGAAHAQPGRRVVGKVSVTDAIVYVVGFKETATTDKPAAAVAQKGRKFVPDLVAIVDVEIKGGPAALASCLAETTWAVRLDNRFDLEREDFNVELR